MPEPITPITSNTPPGTLAIHNWPSETHAIFVVLEPHRVNGAVYTIRFQHGHRSHYIDGTPRRHGVFGSELRGVSDA